MSRRIICIGNRYLARDAVGYQVYQALTRAGTVPGVEVIFGGLAGLDLLPWLERVERVVFVDRVAGLESDDPVVVLDAAAVADLAEEGYGHAAGLPYLLRVLPAVHTGEPPPIRVVGVTRADPAAIDEAARCALALVAAPPSATDDDPSLGVMR
jgi:hydrogenase maturation protease